MPQFTREFLKGLELDKDTIDAIMAEHGASVTELKESLENQKKEYEEKYANFEAEKKQLEAQKVELETKNKEGLKAVKRDYAIKRAVTKSAPKDEIGYMAHLDATKIEYDEEKDELKGFDEQDKAIREQFGYLFEKDAGGAEHGGLGGEGGEGATLSLYDAINEAL